MKIPWGEFAPDQQALYSYGATEIKNVVPAGTKQALSYMPFHAHAPLSNAMADRALGGITVRDSSNNVYTYIGTKTKIYRALSTVVDVSNVGGHLTQDGERWEFVKFGSRVIAVNGVSASSPANSPQYIVIGGSNFSDLPGTPPRARHIAIVRDFVMLGNLSTGENRVAWSGFNNSEDWNFGTNQSSYRDIPVGGWVQRIVGGEYGVVFCETTNHRFTYVGPPTIFQRDEIEGGRGTPAPGSVIRYSRDIYYLSNDGFYNLQEGLRSIPIAEERVDRWFFDNADRDEYWKISSAIDPLHSLIYWLFQSVYSTTGECDRVMIYNWALDVWSWAEIDMEILLLSSTFATTLEDIDSAFGNDLDALPFSLDSDILKGGQNLLLSGVNLQHKFGHFSGEALTAVLTSKEIDSEFLGFGAKNRFLIDTIMDLTEGSGTSAYKLLTRNTLKESPVETMPQTVNQNSRAKFRKNARYQRVQATITGGFDRAPGFEIEDARMGQKR